MYPALKEGVVNTVKQVFGAKPGKRPKPMHRHLKSGLLAAGIAGALASPLEDRLQDAGERIYGDVASLIDKEYVPRVPKPEPVDIPQQPQGDVDLEDRIQVYVDGLRRKGLARSRGTEDYAIFAKDLHSGEVLADINSNRPQWAASANKVYVLLALMHQAEQKKFSYGSETTRKAERMIRLSKNNDTDELIRLAGGEDEVNRILHDVYGFSEGTQVREIRQAQTGGRTVDNFSTVADYGRFFEMDRLFDSTCTPGQPSSLKRKGGYVDEVQDKTGYIIGANTNVGLLDAHFYNPSTGVTTDVPYVVAVMIEDKKAKRDGFLGRSWGRKKSNVIRSLSELFFWDRHDEYSGMPDCVEHGGAHPQ